jgi:hypothetical protein
VKKVTISPAGWPLRRFNLEPLADLLKSCAPPLIEVSKELIRKDLSLKALARTLSGVRASAGVETAFAGTTDFVSCGGFPWPRYRLYLGVQVAQARFLECTLFRALLGEPAPAVSLTDLIGRVRDFCSDAAPLQVCIEIHGGVESDPAALAELLRRTAVKIVVDCANVDQAGLSLDRLLETVPGERIAYFHQRNLPGVWTEYPASLEDERRCHRLFPRSFFLWEPKTVDDPQRIQELFREYRTSY